MSDNVMQHVIESAEAVQQGLDRGDVIYGKGHVRDGVNVK